MNFLDTIYLEAIANFATGEAFMFSLLKFSYYVYVVANFHYKILNDFPLKKCSIDFSTETPHLNGRFHDQRYQDLMLKNLQKMFFKLTKMTI